MSVSGGLGACGISVDLLEVDPKLVCRVDVRHASAGSVHVMPALVGFEVGLVLRLDRRLPGPCQFLLRQRQLRPHRLHLNLLRDGSYPVVVFDLRSVFESSPTARGETCHAKRPSHPPPKSAENAAPTGGGQLGVRSSRPQGAPLSFKSSRNGPGGSASGPSKPTSFQAPEEMSSRATTGLMAVCQTTA